MSKSKSKPFLEKSVDLTREAWLTQVAAVLSLMRMRSSIGDASSLRAFDAKLDEEMSAEREAWDVYQNTLVVSRNVALGVA